MLPGGPGQRVGAAERAGEAATQGAMVQAREGGEPVACFLGVRGVSGASELVPFGGAKVGVSPLHWPCTGDEPSEHSGCRHPGEMRYRNVTGNRSGAKCPGVGRALTKPLA